MQNAKKSSAAHEKRTKKLEKGLDTARYPCYNSHCVKQEPPAPHPANSVSPGAGNPICNVICASAGGFIRRLFLFQNRNHDGGAST